MPKLWAVAVALAILGACSSRQAASPWLALGNRSVALDTANTPSDSIGRRFRLRSSEQALVRGSGTNTAVPFKTELHFYLDCAARRVRDIELRLYSPTDSLLNSLSVADTASWRPFEGHFLVDQLPMDTVCAALRRVGKL